MMRVLVGAVAATCALVAVSAPALAHHSGAMFDRTKRVTIVGTVTEFQYTNPHSWLHVSGAGPDGKTADWGFEAEGPSTLMRAGIKARTFKPGDKVTVVGSPMRDGRPAGSLISVTMADGTVITPRAPPPVPG
ncbi:MAG: DUF6152 family protein [Caulobacteraceae bacterium]